VSEIPEQRIEGSEQWQAAFQIVNCIVKKLIIRNGAIRVVPEDLDLTKGLTLVLRLKLDRTFELAVEADTSPAKERAIRIIREMEETELG